MSVYDSSNNISRPPPRRKRSLRIGTPGVPLYRDIKVLRAVAQLVFAVLFISGIIYLLISLGVNLRASNLTIDWGLYQRPFTVAISEGIPLTEEWAWANNLDLLTAFATVIWVLILGSAALNTYRSYKAHQELQFRSVALLLTLLFLFFVVAPPATIAQVIETSLSAGTVSRAFVTGIYNTLRVVIASLIVTTLLGIFVGIGLLTNNFLVRNVAQIYVEIFRNTPLLVQLVFINWLLTAFLPLPRNSISLPSPDGEELLFALNNRGLYTISYNGTDTTLIFLVGLVVGIVVALVLRRRRFQYQEQTGEPSKAWLYMLLAIGIGTAAGWLLSGGTPFALDYPVLRGPNVREGTPLSASFVSVFLGLTLYTSAFVADIVRAGIQSVPYGQIEAARSQGLTSGQVLNLVVLPQALRLIIPPLGNQYVNMGKNSSLALVVGYFDTYQIALLANNESGQAVPIFVGLMLIYLSLSLSFSAMMNLVNRTTQVRTR